MSGRDYGAFSYYYVRENPAEVAAAIAADGFQLVQLSELPVHPGELTAANCHSIRQVFLDHGVGISNVYLHGNLSHPHPYVRDDVVHRVRAMIRWVRLLGTDIVSAMPGSLDPDNEWNPHPENASDESLERLASTIRDLARYAAGHGVRLCLEPFFLSVAHTAERMKHLIDVGDGSVGVMYDPAATIGPDRAEDSASAMRHDLGILHDHLDVVHYEDVTYENGRARYVLPGRGIVDWSTYFDLLKRYGWDGPFHLEIHDRYDEQRRQIDQAMQGTDGTVRGR